MSIVRTATGPAPGSAPGSAPDPVSGPAPDPRNAAVAPAQARDSTRLAGSGDTFHAGERALQDAAGSRAVLEEHGGRLVRDLLPDQHRTFFAQLPFVVVGGLDGDRQPWATIWAGPPGFLRSPDPQRLLLRPQSIPAGDPLAGHWRVGDPLALLGIEPHTRRRNRANGRLARVAAGEFELDVRQSFGNCPKYIVPRRAQWLPQQARALADSGASHAGIPGRWSAAAGLDAAGRALIARSDTFFIASAAPGADDPLAPTALGLDVSHRAGPPGFAQLEDGADGPALCVPDFAGNRFFNTLGNLRLEPRTGLLFVDFASGRLLWVAGVARIDEDPAAVARVPGAQRLLRIAIRSSAWSGAALPLQWASV